jgi:hypothetical protein
MKILIASAVAVSALLPLRPAFAADRPSGLELGLRTGYGIPLGQSTGTSGDDLNNVVSGEVPVWFDLGYRLPSQLYVGAFAQYGIAFLADKLTSMTGCGQNGLSCSANVVLAGANVHYHVAPEGPFDPWLGVGIGYEWLNFSALAGGRSGSFQAKGWQFVNFQVGGDYKVTTDLGIGPFAMFGLGQYDSASTTTAAGTTTSQDITNQALHEWLTFGIRGVYDVSVSSSHSAPQD